MKSKIFFNACFRMTTALLLAGAACASGQTWTGADGGDWGDSGNWSPAVVPNQPSADAVFGDSPVTSVSIGDSYQVSSINFSADAPAYYISVSGSLDIYGGGIIGSSTVIPTIEDDNFVDFHNASAISSASFTNYGFAQFNDTSSAGNAAITNSSVLYFYDNSTAGSATITNQVLLTFAGTSQAGQSIIDNASFGSIYFTENSGAASARITNESFATLGFSASSSAGQSLITNLADGSTDFGDNATAEGASIDNSGGSTAFASDATSGSATITNENGGATTFSGDADAGTSLISNTSGGTTFFQDTSSGATASISLHDGGVLDVSGYTGTTGGLSIGSISGTSGSIITGNTTLIIGGLQDNTAFGGSVSGSGTLVKTGSGTFTLSGSNSYTGGTRVIGGMILIGNDDPGASPLGTGPVDIGVNGSLGGAGTISGATTVEGTLSPGDITPGQLTFTSDLSLMDTATIKMDLASLSDFDRIEVDGVLIYNGTLIIDFTGGYLPGINDQFALFSDNGFAPGTMFNSIIFDTAGYAGEMDYNTGVLTIVAVPEPAWLALPGFALVTLALVRRRRNGLLRQA